MEKEHKNQIDRIPVVWEPAYEINLGTFTTISSQIFVIEDTKTTIRIGKLSFEFSICLIKME